MLRFNLTRELLFKVIKYAEVDTAAVELKQNSEQLKVAYCWWPGSRLRPRYVGRGT